MADDEESKALSKVMLILKILEDADPEMARKLVRTIASDEGQERVRKELYNVADTLSLDPAMFDKRLSTLGDTIYGVGFSWGPIETRHRRLIRQLTELSSTMAEWAIERLNEAAEQARFCAEVADHTLKIGRETLDELDQLIANPRPIVEHWNEQYPGIERLCSRLDWLLDGWSEIIQWWQLSHDGGESTEIAAIEQIVTVLPLIPRSELSGSLFPEHSSTCTRGRKWVRVNVDWRTGEVDSELQLRLESLKVLTI